MSDRRWNEAWGAAAVKRRPIRRQVLSAEEGYALWAPTYDRDPNPLAALEERILLPVLGDLSGADALDLACGTGRWLEKLRARGARSAVGVDLSAAMLSVARHKSQLLVRADASALPVRSGFASLVICSLALGHLPDLAALARELARATRRGAVCYVSDLHPTARARGWRTGFRSAGRSAEIECVNWSREQVCSAFAAHGFRFVLCLEPSLGEPEKPIFAQAGKSHLFRQATRLPALLVCCFARLASATRDDE